jgi:L-amino acid N-acyltransferase YncA
VKIRDAVPDDVVAINALNNALIDTTTVAWTEIHEDLKVRQAWMTKQRQVGNPILVAEADGQVIGFASYDDFRDSSKWRGYRFTVEHSVHIDEAHHGAGVGRELMEALIARATEAGKHVMIGAIDGENEVSIRFHQRLGFTEVARMPETGFKFDRWLDLVLVQRVLGSG